MEVHALYASPARQRNIALEMVKSSDILPIINDNSLSIKTQIPYSQPDFILFFDKNLRLACHLEKMGYKLYNSSKAISYCDDKWLTAQILADNDIRLAKTMVSSLHYQGFIEESADEKQNAIACIEDNFSYPLVVKEVHGSFGSQVYLLHNRLELMQKRNALLYTPHIYQEFISSSRGRDIRLNVVGNKVVASVLRICETDFRANVTNGGVMHAYTPSAACIAMAVKASQLLCADFSGVDILFGDNDEPIVCEVNSNAHIKSIYDCTGINIAHAIFDHILDTL